MRYRDAVPIRSRDASPSSPRAPRYGRLDVLRGVAMVWMAVFHFCFDLNYFGLIHARFVSDPFWTTQRACIVTLFLFCAGFGQAIAQHQQQTAARFWRRWAQVAVCALLVSVGSWFMFPRTFIWFGVLHGIAAMLLIVRFTARWRLALWPLGAIALALPFFVAHPVFDPPRLAWIGLVTHKPATEDFVPLLPWLGVIWWGVAAGQLLLAKRPAWVTGALPFVLRPLAALGRWPLSFYMLHQPVLLGALTVFISLRGAAH